MKIPPPFRGGEEGDLPIITNKNEDDSGKGNRNASLLDRDRLFSQPGWIEAGTDNQLLHADHFTVYA